MSLLVNEESITDIIKDIDCIQETQQYSVTIEHTWSIKDVFELITEKRPGEKIESEQFCYENGKNECENQTDLDTNTSSSKVENKQTFSLLPSSYSLNFELACNYLVNNSLWRLEINRSSDLNYISLSANLVGLINSTIDLNLFKLIEQHNLDTELLLKLKFYLLNDKMNDIFEKNMLEIKLDLKKCLNKIKLNSNSNSNCINNNLKNYFLIEKFKLDKFCKIKNFLNWLNSLKSDDFCLLAEFKLYTKSLIVLNTNTKKLLSSKCDEPKSQSYLILNFKHAWMIKNWKNYLQSGKTSHKFLNDYEISSLFENNNNHNNNNNKSNIKLNKRNEFDEECDEPNEANLQDLETIKFGKFRSKLFSLILNLTDSSIQTSSLSQNKIENLLKQVKWKLQLYPNGYSHEYENNLSLFVNFSQLSGELSQFSANCINKKFSNYNNKSKNIQETFYDSNENLGLILLIKSSPSSQDLNSNEDEDEDYEENDYLIQTNETSNNQNINNKKKLKRKYETFVKASFQISILDSNSKKVDKCQSEKQLFELYGSWGYKEYMTVKDLIDLKDKYLSNNYTTLNLNCKIVLFYTITNKNLNSIEHHELRNSPVNFSSNPKCLVSNSLTVATATSSPSSSSTSSSSSSSDSMDKIDLIKNHKLKKFNNFKKSSINECNSLVYDMQRLFLKPEMFDLVVQAPICLNNEESGLKEFKVHKLILSIRSEVFLKMFQNSSEISRLDDLNKNLLFINDFDSFTVEVFLNYLYTDILEINFKHFKLNLTNGLETVRFFEDESSDEDFEEDKSIKTELYTHIFIELFKISDKYSVHRLKQISENQLIKLINTESIIDLLILSYLHNSNKLKKKCFHFLSENVSSVITQPGWSQLEKNYPGLLAESFRVLYFNKRENL